MTKRTYRREIAENTLAILNAGHYINASGETIRFADQQKHAEANTIVYTPEASDKLLSGLEQNTVSFDTVFEVNDLTTLDAVRKLISEGHKNVACLNFASAKNAGGGFLGGSQAQEESIARATGLYPCLQNAPEYYKTNKRSKTCFYTDYMIYSPAVPILKDEEGQLLDAVVTAGIITAPAVNTGVVKEREPHRLDEVETVMRRRIAKVLAIALEHGHTTLVLGAWGCGVFRNDPEDVAKWFADVISSQFAGKFEKLVFAVYAGNPRFITPFHEVFGR